MTQYLNCFKFLSDSLFKLLQIYETEWVVRNLIIKCILHDLNLKKKLKVNYLNGISREGAFYFKLVTRIWKRCLQHAS